ncbi:MAG: DUF4350 domain-containing protein [Prevotella sp.]|nr:DUF4350 domain-containing protein [Prevotella sp.]
MNSRAKFVLVIVLMLVAVVLIEYRLPRRFDWTPTFAHDDPQPFGCMVFDSIMGAAMPCGYSVERRTLWQLQRDSVLTEPHGLLIVSNEMLGENDLEEFLSLAEAGHVVLVATTASLYSWEDTLGIDFDWRSEFSIKRLAGKNPGKVPIHWNADNVYPQDSIVWVYEQMISRTVTVANDSLPFTSLAECREGDYAASVALSLSKGQGELIIVTTPLLLTNYAMLNHDNGAVLIHRLMNRMGHLPVIRLESYVKGAAVAEESPFYVLLQHPPLRWALYLTVLGVLCFCIFTARRRQRPIPVIPQRKNGNLEFVRLIGMLYWQEGDHQGLLRKKLAYTAEEIRRQTGLDIMDAETEQDTTAQLARLTGMEADNLRFVLRNVKMAVDPAHVVTEPEMKTLIAELDKITDSI